MRTINGFTVEATTYPEGPGHDFYEPAVRVSEPGTGFVDVVQAVTQNLETQTQDEALAAAQAWLQKIDSVAVNGVGAQRRAEVE